MTISGIKSDNFDFANADRRIQVIAKIFLIVACLAALAALAYFSAGMAIPLFTTGAFGIKPLVGSCLLFGSFVSLAASPIFAAHSKMWKATSHPLQDCRRFVTCLTATLVLSLGAFWLRRHT